ncbi:hypothetical protein [Glycomyces sp. NRRL B-16210]|uniref:hypothetical protein n=1 Tax=Glycomyces sp. NRRL B-16210 TaxID=1463821 RepID=UPI0004BE6C03|nr:hypothetical protein [Glycomyces sp. NRRL B-16210]
MLTSAAVLATVLLAALVVFQAMLALGAPIGHFSWGGAHRVLPTRFRIGSALAIPIYVFIILLMLDKAAVVSPFGQAGWATVAFWVVTVFFILNIPLNALSRSKHERALVTPTVAVLAILFLYVGLTA